MLPAPARTAGIRCPGACHGLKPVRVIYMTDRFCESSYPIAKVLCRDTVGSTGQKANLQERHGGRIGSYKDRHRLLSQCRCR
jgi:hypothetical protein